MTFILDIISVLVTLITIVGVLSGIILMAGIGYYIGCLVYDKFFSRK